MKDLWEFVKAFSFAAIQPLAIVLLVICIAMVWREGEPPNETKVTVRVPECSSPS